MSEAAAPRFDKALTAPLTLKAGDDAGHVQALFSVYNTIDSVQDVVLPGAFLEGEEVPMAVNHDWGRLGVGKGVIRSSPQGAIFDGHFLLNTFAGREAYEHVKGMAGLQEWSFGFSILDAEPGKFEGQPVRFLKRVQLHEVSPVFKGANSHTATLAIKAALEEEKAVWSAAYVNDLPDSAFAYVEPGGEKDSEGKTTPRSLRHFPHHSAEGSPDPAHVRNALARIPQSDVPESAKASAEAHVRRHANGLDIGKADDEEDRLTNLRDYFQDLAQLQHDAKAGRVLSEATRRRIRAVRDQWAAQLAELDQLLADTESPAKPATDPALLELRAQFMDFRARHRDVIGEWGE
jgi:HK97 family phage prohead protease